MRNKILLSLCILCSLYSFCQDKSNTGFAIVGNATGSMNWTNIQEIDFSTGKVIRSIFNENATPFVFLDAKTKKKLSVAEDPFNTTPVTNKTKTVKSGLSISNTANAGANPNVSLKKFSYVHPTSGMVAAAAYDARHNKLFFTPMHYAELRWIDLYDRNETLQVYCLPDNLIGKIEPGKENDQFTRMVIAADGNGYILSNDANQFVKFSTGKSIEVSLLGKLNDATANQGVSIHDRKMFGGDMIADAFGNLFLITATSGVFKIEIKSMEAHFLGSIEGLPKSYTTNGAAINANGELIVSSANLAVGFFKVDLGTLKAQKYSEANQPVSSDLASGNLAFSKEAEAMSKAELRNTSLGLSNNQITVYPNPVRQGMFKVNFNTTQAGTYQISLVDLSGKIVFQKKVNVSLRNQTEPVMVDLGLAKGVYNVKVSNSSGKFTSAQHILIQ